jgi:integration host factor subunit alpha
LSEIDFDASGSILIGLFLSYAKNIRIKVFMTLTKADIAKKIADECGFMKGEATEVFEKLLEIIKTKLIDGEDVMISGFGKWRIRSKRARRGRNPQTGEHIFLDARRVVTWIYSPVLKKAVNGSHKELK